DAIPPHPPLPQYYGEPSQRERFVRDIFDETAAWYDDIIGMLSFGSGNRYRLDALRRAGLTADTRLLDLATGTGVVARAASTIAPRLRGAALPSQPSRAAPGATAQRKPRRENADALLLGHHRRMRAAGDDSGHAGRRRLPRRQAARRARDVQRVHRREGCHEKRVTSVLYFHGFAWSPASAKITALRPLLAPHGIELNTPD